MVEPLHGAVISQALALAGEGALEPHAAADRLVIAAGGDRDALIQAREELLARLREEPDDPALNRALTILNLTVGGEE
jgi:hypothetical protein